MTIYRVKGLHETGDDRYIFPKNLPIEAVKQNDEVGSCTACIVNLDVPAKMLQTANLGDSGYMLLRQKELENKLIAWQKNIKAKLPKPNPDYKN